MNLPRWARRAARAIAAAIARITLPIRGVVAAFRLVRDPNRLGEVFVLDRFVTTPRVRTRILKAVRSDPAAARALQDRRPMVPVALTRLRSLDEGTLGRVFADSMIARGLDPAAIPTVPFDDDDSFIKAHLYATHDLWHVVTGFDTDVAGELGMQAFYSAQLDGALARLLIVGGLIHSMWKAPDDWGARLACVARGWTLGRQARAFFGVPWDALWTTPLGAVRSSLGLPIEERRQGSLEG